MLKNPKKIELVTADGAPLKLSLAKAQRRSKVVAFLMVSPLLIFMVFAFFILTNAEPISPLIYKAKPKLLCPSA